MNTNERTLNRNTAFLLILEGFLIFAPLIILGAAIEWPATLGDPAEIMLPRIYEESGAVALGYFTYLIYSVLFWPVALLTARVIAGKDEFSPLLRMAVGFGIASAVLRTLGIVRWLFPMPVLAKQYVDPTTSEATREAISVTYTMLNEYAGAVGEVLGVSLFAAMWVILLSVVILQTGALPRWVAYFGFIAGAGLASSLLEVFGVDMGAFITATVTLIHFWFWAVAAVLLRRNNRATESNFSTVTA